MTDYEPKEKPIKGYLSDRDLLQVYKLKSGNILRVEDDEWGKFIRVIDEKEWTIFSKLVIDEENLDRYIKEVKLRYS